MGLIATVGSFANLWLLSEADREQCALMAIEIVPPNNTYVDESIQYEFPENKGRKLYAVTAYIATFDRWIELEQRWQEILDNFESPPFHFTDFMARGGDYYGLDWSDQKRNDYLTVLCATAAEHTIAGFGCAIYQDDYERALPDELREAWIDPYYFCVYGMLSLVDGAGRRQFGVTLPRPLYFLFDEKKTFAGAALRLFADFKEVLVNTKSENADLFGDAAFGSRKKYKPLQAADLLVGVVNRRFREMVFKLPYKMEKPLDRLARKRNMFVAFPNKKLLTQYVEFLREGKGVVVAPKTNPKR